ncbi:YbaB/EbfC family nucleoid-associated protein [Mycobacterium sp. 050134]|uniref:YbaB/EbfC family nucleoid-associated protein n=1 Tax=Mycobacterium sp. 050134 TaxID=3096111 RepID=UPI002EDB30CF
MTGGLADSLLARIKRQRDLLNAMDEHCRNISVRVTSGDRSVSVEVDGSGQMTGLWLADFAYRRGADALAKLITDTARVAAAHAADRQSHLLTEFTEQMSALRRAPLTGRNGASFQPGTGWE